MEKRRKFIRTGMFIFCFLLAFVNSLKSQDSDSSSYISLKPSEFIEEIKNVNNYLIIDVREPFELSGGMLKEAINIPSSGELDRVADTLSKSCNLFLYCTTGVRSSRAAKKLVERGFNHVYSLEGGITAWKKEGFEVSKRKIRRRDQITGKS